MNEELRECPFCGETNDLFMEHARIMEYIHRMPYIVCKKCGFAIAVDELCIDINRNATENEEEWNRQTIERWNTRPAEDVLKKEIKELEAEKQRLLKAINVIAENAVEGLNIGIDFIGAGLDGMTGGQKEYDKMMEIRDTIAKFIKDRRRNNE